MDVSDIAIKIQILYMYIVKFKIFHGNTNLEVVIDAIK